VSVYERPHVAIISARRPGAVQDMAPHLGDMEATWYVADGEAALYRDAGAANVVEAGPLCRARNLAIERAFEQGQDCLQLSDDCTGFQWATGTTRAETQPIALRAVARHLWRAADQVGAYLAGAMPTGNPFYAAPGRIQREHFIVGDTMLIRRGTPLRFDENLLLKEDYDYTAQHLYRHGRVARLGSLLAGYRHGSNPGGAVAYRDPHKEQAAISLLKAKWPLAIRDNPRRANEVLFKWPKGAR
jgi:hypothetical protein